MIYKKHILVFFLLSIIWLQHYNELDFICDYDGDGKYDCELFLKFAGNNYLTNDFQGAVDQYMTMITCNCIKGQESYIYENLGRSFSKIGKPDSSTWSFKQGLKVEPESKILLELAAWSVGQEIRKGNTNKEKEDEQLYFLDRLLEISPKDFLILEKMSDFYKRSERYEEQIEVLDRWLKIDPSSKKAISNKKTAFEILGMDASDVDRERWEKESSNLEYGLFYIKSLFKNEEYTKSIEVGEELLLYHENEKRLLQLISDIYIKDLNDSKAAKYIEKLLIIDPINTEYIIKLSNVYINLAQYDKAYNLSNQAILSKTMLGKSYYQRAEVLVQLVDYYRSEELDFCDRLVYELAVEDYKKAYDNGFLQANKKKNMFIEMDVLTTIGDWFLLGDKYTKMSPDSEECSKMKDSDCYSFINNREVVKK